MTMRTSSTTLTLIAGLMLAGPAAADALRVGTHVIATGDSAGHVVDLIGKPDRKSHAAKKKGEGAGERWEYHRDHKTVLVTFRDGAVTTVSERLD